MPPHPKLTFVRKDSKHVVTAAYPRDLGYSELADRLTAQFGVTYYTLYIGTGIYIIYLDVAVVGDMFVSEPSHCLDQSSQLTG